MVDDARAALARIQAKHEKITRKLRKAGVHVPADLQAQAESIRAAVRASVRKALAEEEVEKRLAVRAGSDRMLRVGEVKKITGLGRTTIWQLEQRGEFPARRKLMPGSRAIGWLASDIARWVAARQAAP